MSESKLNAYAVASGEKLACVAHHDPRSAATLAVLRWILETDSVELEDQVYVAELLRTDVESGRIMADQFITFDTGDLFGGLAEKVGPPPRFN